MLPEFCRPLWCRRQVSVKAARVWRLENLKAIEISLQSAPVNNRAEREREPKLNLYPELPDGAMDASRRDVSEEYSEMLFFLFALC